MRRRFSVFHPAKEGVKGLLHTAKGVLKNLAVNLAYIIADLVDLRKLDGLNIIVDRKTVDLIGVTHLLQRRIIKLAANV